MRKTNKIILTSLILIVAGIALLFTGFGLGGQVYGFSLNQNGFQVFAPSLQPESSNTYIKETISLESFDSIDADMEFCEIRLVAGNHYSLSYNLSSTTILNYDIIDGTLQISENYKNSSKHAVSVQWFSIGTINNSSNHETEYIEISVPQDVLLKDIHVTDDYGDIYLHDFSAGNVYIKSDYSIMELENLAVSSLEIKSQSGELQIADTTGDSLSITNKYGNMELSDLNITKNADFSVSSGCLELDNTYFHSWSIDSEYGDINGHSVSCNSANLTSQSSNCKIKEFTVNSFEADSKYGDIALQLTASTNTYSYDLSTEYGEIDLDNWVITTQNSFIHSSDSPNSIHINSQSGNIKISGS